MDEERGKMKVMHQYMIEKLHFPVDGYQFIVSTLTSVDCGKNFYYCGNSKYFKTEQEALQYKEKLEGRA